MSAAGVWRSQSYARWRPPMSSLGTLDPPKTVSAMGTPEPVKTVSTPNTSDLAKSIAGWLIGVGGLIYISGFLVSLNFAERMGLRDSGAAFFKPRYIHVGILYLSLPVILIGATHALLALRKLPHVGEDGRTLTSQRIYPASSVLIFNLLLVFYAFIMFAPPGYLRPHRPFAVFMVFAATAFGLLFIKFSSNWLRAYPSRSSVL